MARQEMVFDGEYTYADGRHTHLVGWTEDKAITRIRHMVDGEKMSLTARPRPTWYDDAALRTENEAMVEASRFNETNRLA